LSPRGKDAFRKTKGSIYVEDATPMSGVKSLVDGGALSSAILIQEGTGNIPVRHIDTPILDV